MPRSKSPIAGNSASGDCREGGAWTWCTSCRMGATLIVKSSVAPTILFTVLDHGPAAFTTIGASIGSCSSIATRHTSPTRSIEATWRRKAKRAPWCADAGRGWQRRGAGRPRIRHRGCTKLRGARAGRRRIHRNPLAWAGRSNRCRFRSPASRACQRPTPHTGYLRGRRAAVIRSRGMKGTSSRILPHR